MQKTLKHKKRWVFEKDQQVRRLDGNWQGELKRFRFQGRWNRPSLIGVKLWGNNIFIDSRIAVLIFLFLRLLQMRAATPVIKWVVFFLWLRVWLFFSFSRCKPVVVSSPRFWQRQLISSSSNATQFFLRCADLARLRWHIYKYNENVRKHTLTHSHIHIYILFIILFIQKVLGQYQAFSGSTVIFKDIFHSRNTNIYSPNLSVMSRMRHMVIFKWVRFLWIQSFPFPWGAKEPSLLYFLPRVMETIIEFLLGYCWQENCLSKLTTSLFTVNNICVLVGGHFVIRKVHTLKREKLNHAFLKVMSMNWT